MCVCFFYYLGTECGLTRCMEMSHGTALATLGSNGCVCQCRRESPAFREDQKVCVDQIDGEDVFTQNLFNT